MPLRLHDDAGRFLEAARPLWEPREAELNLFIGVATRLARGPLSSGVLLATLGRGERCAAAVLRTPPHGFVVAAEDEDAAEALAHELAGHGHAADAPSLLASAPFAARFAHAWASAVDRAAEVGMAQRIYALEEVDWPALPSGTFRAARADEIDRLAVWVRELSAEASPHAAPTLAEVVATLHGHLGRGALHVWALDDIAVSVAALIRETPHGAAVSAVCTLPEHRRRGYASACVASISRLALDRGKRFTCLHTDAANPTSNAIYQRVGYRFVCAAEQWVFVSRKSAGIAALESSKT